MKPNFNHQISDVPRVRFAPSPTGYLHVGGARTALFCYLFAKRFSGQFILRVEDTDQERSTEESLRLQLADLKWLGLKYVEGIDPDSLKDFGPYGPYRQSHRLGIYREHAERLLNRGQAYYCFLTDAEIEKQKAEAAASGQQGFQVQSPFRDWPLSKALDHLKSGHPAVVRFKTAPQKRDYKFNDLVRGEVVFPSDMVGDFVLLRSGGMPVYNFCCVVDDALMKITHVLRAEEHLSNTLRQLMLYEAFGYPVPEFGHMSIILGPDKQKLSKRHGATSVHEYSEKGYLPEAINNFIALLGWSTTDDREIFSVEELGRVFSVDRLNPAPAVFDETKLKWMNAQHLRAIPLNELWQRVKGVLDKAGFQFSEGPLWQARVLEVFKIRMETLLDAVELMRPLSSTSFSISEESKEALGWPATASVVKAWRKLVVDHPQNFVEEAEFNSYQDQVKQMTGVGGKNLFMPIRVAVIGKPQGADLKALVPLMPKSELLARADQVLKVLGA